MAADSDGDGPTKHTDRHIGRRGDLTTDLGPLCMWRGQKRVFWLRLSECAHPNPISMIYGLTKPTDHLVPHVPIINARLTHTPHGPHSMLPFSPRTHRHTKTIQQRINASKDEIVKLVKSIVTLDRSINQFCHPPPYILLIPLCLTTKSVVDTILWIDYPSSLFLYEFGFLSLIHPTAGGELEELNE